MWKLKRWNSCRLSPTPRVPSKGWDAASTRIATIGQFEHFQTGQAVIITITQLEDQGTEAQKRDAKPLLEVLRIEAGLCGASATILAGEDFNSPPRGDAYEVLTAPESMIMNVANIIPPEQSYGNEMTFTGFFDGSTPSRVDFIFARKKDKIKYETYAVLANCFDDGVFLSYHRACVADFRLLPDD